MIGYILLTLLVLILSWTTFNLTRKVERLETWIENYAERIQETKRMYGKRNMFLTNQTLLQSPDLNIISIFRNTYASEFLPSENYVSVEKLQP